MATINLGINFSNDEAIATRVRYARIDNVISPSWVTVSPDPVSSPANIATDIPNGQYRIGYKAVYSDLRSCDEQFVETPPCPGLISINAYIDGGNLVVQYLAPSEVPKVRITVNYPNGGSWVANYVNNGSDIAIALPTNVYGDFIVSGQSVCDEESSFYSTSSASVSVNRSQFNLRITSSGAGITVTDITGINGFTLGQVITPGVTINSSHGAFLGTIGFTFTGTPALDLNSSLYINNVLAQCVNIPNTNGGTVSFNSISVDEGDFIDLSFNTGLCP